MKKFSLSILALIFCFTSFSQTDKKPTQIAETIYILPKAGMSTQFENAISAHNKKFHPVGPHHAMLRRVEYGAKAGWYVWVMIGTYDSLDSRPVLENGHQDDWDKTVGPTVEEYGDTGLWNYNEDLSFGRDILMKSKKYYAWNVDVKRGQGDRFEAILKKLQETYKSMNNRAFLVFENRIHTSNGADYGIIRSFDKYTELDTDWGTKVAFEKINGEGSWKKMVDEWMDVTVDHEEEIRIML